MSFLGGGVPSSSKAKSKSEVLSRAKEARAARVAHGGPKAAAARDAAALAATRAARRLLVRACVRRQLADEWHVPVGPLDPGALVSLVNRFLRIARAAPATHVPALCELSRAILSSMDRADGAPTYAHALLSAHLAPAWRAQLPALLNIIVCALEQSRLLLDAAPPHTRHPTSPDALQTWGVLVRLPLVLADVPRWRLAREQADAAWERMQARTVDAALHALSVSGRLSRAAAALVAAYEPAPISSPVLISALALAARPLQPERGSAVERAQCAAFIAHVLTIPALVERLAAAPSKLASRVLDASVVALSGACAPRAARAGEAVGAEQEEVSDACAALAACLDGAAALALLANACALGAKLGSPCLPALPIVASAATATRPGHVPGQPARAGDDASTRTGAGAGVGSAGTPLEARDEHSARASWALCMCASLERLHAFRAAGGAAGAAGAAGGKVPPKAVQSSQTFHPHLGWVVGFEPGACAAHAAAIGAQLAPLASHALLATLWGDEMAAPLRARTSAGTASAFATATARGDDGAGAGGGGGLAEGSSRRAHAHAAERGARALVRCAPAVRFILIAGACLPDRRAELLATAAFSTLLLSRLWARLAPLIPELVDIATAGAAAAGGEPGDAPTVPKAFSGITESIAGIFTTTSVLARSGVGIGGQHATVAALRATELFARSMAVLVPTLDEAELDGAAVDDDGTRRRFSRADLRQMAPLLNALAWACVSHGTPAARADGAPSAPPPASGAEPVAAARGALGGALVALVALLRERHVRRALCDERTWLLPGAARAAAAAEAGCAADLALLCQMPWAADFVTRVNVFRALVAADKLAVRGGDGSAGRPRTAPELLITVRRARLLHDGYAQLAHQPHAALRRVLRVRFVSALGLGEAGIDHQGVFKEFMEDIVRAAFHADLGLFVTTGGGSGGGGEGGAVRSGVGDKTYFPNPHAAALHEDSEQLFEFVGRMLGKALYEGVTLDVPLAPFFVRRVLGGASSIDELPELDTQLYSSLAFVRTYAGDVAELGLTFAVDVEVMGVHSSIELRPGGSAIAVDNANRIHYVHLVADYHLNRRIAEQARAVHRGLMGVLQPGWLRLFSAREVGTLLAGDDVEIDVDDLRRHTVYHGGYHELSPTVRALWAVLKDFSNDERKAFLKFVTSCSQPPLLGFKHLEPKFAVQCVAPGGSDTSALGGMLALVGLTPAERQRLPTAATCFNLLKLPDFRSRKLLREKLLVAIHSNSGFELS